MAYDEELAARVRARLEGEPDYREQKMFGGVGMMLAGNMAGGVVRAGLLVRVDPSEWEDLMTRPGTRPFEMGHGRVPHGWVVVEPEAVTDEKVLAEWVDRGVAFVRTLPSKA